MYSRAKVGAPKGNLGGEPNTKYSDSEIKGKKLEIGAATPKQEEETPMMKAYIEAEQEKNRAEQEKNRTEFKHKYEKGLLEKEIQQYRNREQSLGGSKKVSNKIKRRAKVKNAVDNAIIFLGSSK